MDPCVFCRDNVLRTPKSWGYHHSDALKFEDSVSRRCIFCSRLAEKLGTLQTWFDHDEQPKALYRWTLRESPKIRETEIHHVSLIFRPVPGRVSGGEKSEDLPEVRFELFPGEGSHLHIKLSRGRH